MKNQSLCRLEGDAALQAAMLAIAPSLAFTMGYLKPAADQRGGSGRIDGAGCGAARAKHGREERAGSGCGPVNFSQCSSRGRIVDELAACFAAGVAASLPGFFSGKERRIAALPLRDSGPFWMSGSPRAEIPWLCRSGHINNG